jgi:hypothetical protein
MISPETAYPTDAKGKILCPHCNFAIDAIRPGIKLQMPKLLLVEGKDDECFFCALVEFLQIEDIQVAGVGGKGQFRGQLQAIIKDDDFSKVISLGVIRDADNNPEDAFKSVRDSLRAVGLTPPQRPILSTKGRPKVTVMIVPSLNRKGALEDLCLDALVDDPALKCVNQYFECLDNQNIEPPRELSKAKIRVFLSSRRDPTLPLGISAQKGYWHLDHKAFEKVKMFLQTL